MNRITHEWVEQVDLPGELMDADEQQRLLDELFCKPRYTIPMIKIVMKQGHLTFQQLLDRYESSLLGDLDPEAQAIYKVLSDGCYLSEVWAEISKKTEYKQWVTVYQRHVLRLDDIAEYYVKNEDYGFDLSQSAIDAKNELYLAQTQPGIPQVIDVDTYTGEEIGRGEAKPDTHGSVKHPDKLVGEWAKFKDALNATKFNTAFFKKSEPKVEPVAQEKVEISLPVARTVTFLDVPVEPKPAHTRTTVTVRPWQREIFPLPIRGTGTPKVMEPTVYPDKFAYLTGRIPIMRREGGEEFITKSIPKGDSDYDRFLGEGDEVELFDDRGLVTSSAIIGAEDYELKPSMYSSLRYSDVGKKIKALRDTAIQYRKENFLKRKYWQKWGLPRKPKFLDEATLQHTLKRDHAEELTAIKDGLNELAQNMEKPQDILLLLTDGTYFDFLAEEIKLPANALAAMTLEEFDFLYGDEVFEHAYNLQNPPGWHKANEFHYSQLIDKVDIMSSMTYDESKVEQSRLFNEVVMEYILKGDGVKQAYKQAHHACKMSLSEAGEYAYRQAVASGMPYGKVMHAFYEAAYKAGDIPRPRDRVVSVHPDKMVVLTASSAFKQTREINWHVARIKTNNSELYVPADAEMSLKQQVFSAVKSLRWDNSLITKLKE